MLNARESDPLVFERQSTTVCDLYLAAPALAEAGTHLISTDEMTAIQALERAAPTKPMQPGQVERREFEYIRHGTRSLIANLEVATGRIVSPSLGQTRTEVDWVAHIERTVATDAQAGWIFIVDQLNTHWSCGLVELVKRLCQLEVNADELGLKGKSGILTNQATRQAFLEAKTHRIRFVYPPKHASWLNQIEIWFFILMRRLLKRASFSSVEELSGRILSFIDYFNRVAAKPFAWTYTARPLQV